MLDQTHNAMYVCIKVQLILTGKGLRLHSNFYASTNKKLEMRKAKLFSFETL